MLDKNEITKKLNKVSLTYLFFSVIFFTFQFLSINILNITLDNVIVTSNNFVISEIVNFSLYWSMWAFGFIFLLIALIGLYYNYQYKKRDLNNVEFEAIKYMVIKLKFVSYIFFLKDKNSYKNLESLVIKNSNISNVNLDFSFKQDKLYKMIGLVSMFIYFAIFVSSLFILIYFNGQIVERMKEMQYQSLYIINGSSIYINTTTFISISLISVLVTPLSLIGTMGMSMEYLLVNRDYFEEIFVGLIFGIVIVGVLQFISYKNWKNN